MTSALRAFTSAAGLIAAGLLIVGCTATSGTGAPTSSSEPSASTDAGTGSGTGSGDDASDIEGTLLDDGRMFAVVTFGSSGCIPMVDDVSAEGQTVSVTLVEVEGQDGEEVACTADFAPRASVGALPEGVDPTQEITLQVTYGDIVGDLELDGGPAFAAAPGSSTDYQPSAGWFDDGGLVLLTWGSSSCAPVVESAEGAGATGTVTFVTVADQVCTMDMAPRATIVAFAEDTVDDDDFTLTLTGGGLDGTVPVRSS